MRVLLDDLRHSLRLFRHSPGLALAAVASLTLGIGFTTTMFSIVHGGSRALPVPEAEEIVALTETVPSEGLADYGVREADARAVAAALTTFDGVGFYRTGSTNLSGDGGDPERLSAAAITPEAFGLLSVGAAEGRLFTMADAEPGAPPVVLLSDRLWRRRYGAAADAVGRQVRLDGELRTVAGVLPPGFGFPLAVQAWVPLGLDPTSESARVSAFGRLRDGVEVSAAAREAAALFASLSGESASPAAPHGARVFPFEETELPPDLQRALEVLVALVSIVLLVACANVANLLLARAAVKARDTAIRTALGASRRRLIVHQLAESTALAATSCALGIGLAAIGLSFFATASADIIQAYWVEFRIDPVVVAFAAGLGLVASVAAGVLPAIRASAGGVAVLLRAQSGSIAGPRIGRIGRGLVIAQLALACGLMAITATFVGASASLHAVPIPFPADRIVTAQLSVLPGTLSDPEDRGRLIQALQASFEAEPALRDAALVSVFPGAGAGDWSFARLDGPSGGEPRTTGVAMVTPAFFDLAGVSAERGRLLTWQDDDRAPTVAVVNRSFVRRHFGDADPIGHRLQLGTREITIVGVVPDLLMQDVEDADGAGLYVSPLQVRPYTLRVMARTAGPALAGAGALRTAVGRADPDLPVLELASLRDAIYADKKVLDALATLFLGFGLGAVLLALVGLHAVLAFVVVQRTREFGVRMALGADRRDIVRLVLGRGGRELAWGLGLGLIAAFALTRLLASVLDRLPVAGPSVFAGIAAIVAAGAALALWRPLRRAMRLDPVRAMRLD